MEVTKALSDTGQLVAAVSVGSMRQVERPLVQLDLHRHDPRCIVGAPHRTSNPK